MRHPLTSVLALAAASAIATASSAEARAAQLSTGFADSVFSQPPEAEVWLDRARNAGGSVVQIVVGWASVAPTRPQTPSNPADPSYRWTMVDQAVRSATSRGLEVLALVTGAPQWAEGPGKPATAEPATWRPDSAAYRDFAQAAATRYSGAFVGSGQDVLPRVKLWQAWAEPNLDLYLAPQWRRVKGRYVPESPRIYRRLLNAFASGIEAAQSGATIVTAGTAPFGDPPGDERMRPALFVRELLRSPVRFDVLAHHPYSVGGPARRALNRDDVSVPDLAKLTRPLRAAERKGLVLPRGRAKRLWVTEFSWDSAPPDPQGVPERVRARWVSEVLWRFWRQGVDHVVWFLLRDQAPTPSFGSTYQSGLYTRTGRSKRSLQAFRLPVVARLVSRGRALIWIRAPAAGAVVVERRVGRRWIHATTRLAVRNGVVLVRLGAAPGTKFRARVGHITSAAVPVVSAR